MNTTTTSRPVIPPVPQFTYLGTETAFAQRIVSICLLSVFIFPLASVGPKVLQMTMKKRNVFWSLMGFTWLLTMASLLLQWGNNYHIMVHLKGGNVKLTESSSNASMTIFILFFSAYSLLTSLRVYRVSRVILLPRIQRYFNIFVVCHCIWVLFATPYILVGLYAELKSVRGLVLPSLRDIFLATPIYYRGVTWLCDAYFLYVVRSTSILYGKVDTGLSKLQELFYIAFPTMLNTVWLILYLITSTNYGTVASYIGNCALAMEMISFFKYTNHVMECLFDRSRGGSSSGPATGVHSLSTGSKASPSKNV